MSTNIKLITNIIGSAMSHTTNLAKTPYTVLYIVYLRQAYPVPRDGQYLRYVF